MIDYYLREVRFSPDRSNDYSDHSDDDESNRFDGRLAGFHKRREAMGLIEQIGWRPKEKKESS